MALLKARLLNTGFTAEYWKITKSVNNLLTDQTFVTLSLYKDQQSRLDGCDSALNQEMVFDGVDLTREQIYPLIKTSVGFEDSVDC